MAKGRKTGGRDFPPGVSGNPAGSPGLPQDLKNARKLNQVEMERIFNRFLYAGDNERQKTLQDPTAPGIDKLVAAIMGYAISEGDEKRLEFILCRVLGKVTEKLEVKVPEPFVIRRPGGEEVVVGAKEKEDE